MNSESFESEPASNLAANVVLSIAGCIIVAVFFLFVSRMRADARRIESIAKLTNLALAAHNYESAHSVLPSASNPGAGYGVAHGWEFPISGFMEQSGRYDEFDPRLEWSHPTNQIEVRFMKPMMQSPHTSIKEDKDGLPLNHYAATLEVIPLEGSKSLADLDPNLELFGEVAAGYSPIGKPGNSRTLDNGIWFDENSFGNPEYNGVCFAYVDGSVRYQVLEYERR